MSYQVVAPAIQVVVGARAHFLETGAVLPEGVAEADIKRLKGKGFIEKVKTEKVDADTGGDAEPYKGVNVADLKSEIEKRNEGREDDKKIVPAEPGNRPEIVAALVADDDANK